MKGILGPKKRERVAGMLANFAQVVFGAGFLTYFFREGNIWVRIVALGMFVICFTFSVIFEPEKGD